jgi:hypothetical protein
MPSKKLISVGQLIDDSWEAYRSRITEYLAVSCWMLVVAILYVIALAFYPAASKLQFGLNFTGVEMFGVYLYAATFFIISPILTFWIMTSLARMVKMQLARRKPNHKKALKEGREVFIPAAVTTIMVMLMLALSILIGFAPAVVAAGIGQLLGMGSMIVIATVLLMIGMVVTLYLAIRWVGYYFFGPMASMLDGIKGMKALELSRDLIKGRFWGVMARIAVPKLVFIIFGVFAMSLTAFIVGMFIDASAGLNLDLQLRITTMTQTIIPILIVVLINPLIIISDVLLYRSLKETA